ncbi:hypothetical protein PAMC26577_01185 [Caballeronia sordidicola]|uniref:Uncharacterized protein n=1 Tax=Caballeronia sordidicola TaxID=196367 RepID=A0A242N752_CABSO|nr:hypothetical protein PAMC26577_01185 [Caballeronia sordidicola]
MVFNELTDPGTRSYPRLTSAEPKAGYIWKEADALHEGCYVEGDELYLARTKDLWENRGGYDEYMQ